MPARQLARPLTRPLARSFFAVSLLLAAPATAATVAVDLPDGAVLELELPAGWQESHEVRGPSVTVRLTPSGEGDFVVLLTALPIRAGTLATTDEGVRALVTEEGERWLATAVQQRLEVVELRGAEGVAYLYHLTDRNEEKAPGDYREAHQGAARLGAHLVSFTILTHSGDEAVVEQAKRLLAAARIGSGAKA